MTQLGNGLAEAGHHADELIVGEAELALERRMGASEEHMLVTQGNLAMTYRNLGRFEEANRMERAVYSGYLKLNGEQDSYTLQAANNYAGSLLALQRCEEARSLLRRTIPVARRVFGENNELTLKMRWIYGQSFYRDEGATLDHLREAVTTLEDLERTARRVLGSAHPVTAAIERNLQKARIMLRARESLHT